MTDALGAAAPASSDGFSPAAPAVPVATSAPAATSVVEPTPPVTRRSRIRLALIVAALGLWLLPWLGDQRGPDITGATAALGFVAAWGLGATALLARSRRGLLVGEALTSAAIAAALAALVYARHPWLPGPDRTATSLPIFAPLALLALLDAGSRLRRPPLGNEVAAIRAGTALLCAAALFVALDPIPATAAAFLAAAPAAVAFPLRAKAARRAVEALGVVAAIALFVAQDAQNALTARAASPDQPTLYAFLHPLLAIAIGVLFGYGVAVPEPKSGPDATSDGPAAGDETPVVSPPPPSAR